jgi:hypothetical protein
MLAQDELPIGGSAAIASGAAREAGIIAASAIVTRWIDVSDHRYAMIGGCS